MKILLVHKYYFRKGGDCTYFLELEKLLRQRGHEVAIFAMQHPNNISTSFAKYFPSEVDFSKHGLLDYTKILFRPLFSVEVSNKFKALLNDFQPNIVHCNTIHSQLSPLILQIAKKRNIPVVWTQHDYKLLCPAYTCTRNYQPCELCFTDKYNVVKHRCIKGSLAASSLAFFEAELWNKDRLENYTSKFVCPSNFIQSKMIQGGFNQDKIINLPYFINPDSTDKPSSIRKNYCCYVGRLVQEKGLETFLDVSLKFPEVNIIIVGTGPQEEYLKSKYKSEHIKFLGYKGWSDIKEIVQNAKFMVVPSEWYENYPLSIIESLSLGTPVLGSNSGGIPEMITDGINGFIFKSRDKVDLELKLSKLLVGNINFDYNSIQEHCFKDYSASTHYDELINLYNTLLSPNNLN